ncbi:MAG: glycosyltransferase family 4 protein, partial [Bryobacteraceae bacterium]
MPAPLLLLSMQTYGKPGGVPTYTRRLAELLYEYGQSHSRPLLSVCLSDTACEPEQHARPVRYGAFHAAAGSKRSFIGGAIGMTFARRGGLAIVAHIGLAPVALLLKRLGLIDSYFIVLHGIEVWRRVDWADGIAARAAAKNIATTGYTARVFGEANNIPAGRLHVIPLALPDDDLPPAPVPRENPTFEILTAGRLHAAERYKGVDTLLEAVSRLRERGIAARLTIVGEGDDLPRLQEQQARLHLDGNVTFLRR